MTTPMKAPTLLWFRQDLRLADNPALAAAVARGSAVVPVFILDDQADTDWGHGAAMRWALHHALQDLQHNLKEKGATLILRSGDSLQQLRALARETGADTVLWNRRYTPAFVQQDIAIKEALTEDGLNVESFKANLLFEPWEIQNGQKLPYRVFTPYWNTLQAKAAQNPPQTIPAPRAIPHFPHRVDSDALTDWPLLPQHPDWSGGMQKAWAMTEQEAAKRLDRFIDHGLSAYSNRRDFPAEDQTSCLSPYLALGLISPRRIWDTIRHGIDSGHIEPRDEGQAEAFLRQIAWREFSYHLLFYFPHTTTKALQPKFDHFPWRYSKRDLRAWQRGQTGYPLVDAGMRQLWQTGWMHNRVRLVVASFLVKHLLLPWQQGSEWFWDTLVDADLANNTMGWQWTAGSGADAAPYFRIFNPVTQSEKFDDAGNYIRTYVPELAALPDKYIHAPWKAPAGVLAQAGITLGRDYPEPMVDHDAARARALDALKEI